jgi:tyrosine-protein kinase Etk/Wzc
MAVSGVAEGRTDKISLLDLAARLWKGRKLIAVITAISAIGGVIYSLALKNTYTAIATVIPITSSPSSSLTQLAGLAQMAGVSISRGATSDPSVKIEAILKSRSLAERLISDLDLVPALVKKPDKVKAPRTAAGLALEYLMKKSFSVTSDDKTSLITISAETEDPKLSRDIANRAVLILEEILNAKALTVSKKNLQLYQDQIAEQEQKMQDLQKQLTDYQKKTKILTPEGQVEQTMTLYSSLIQQKIATEIDLSRLESALSSDNPRVVSLRSQLDAIDRQIQSIQGATAKGGAVSLSDTPDALVKYQNIFQDLEIATKIYEGLLANLENEKLQENQDQLFVEVIDPAVAPEKKSAPRRSLIVIAVTTAGVLFSVLLLFGLDAYGELKKDQIAMEKFRRTATQS